MFDRFGEFDSYEEINEAAEGLFNEGDLESLRLMAAENGLESVAFCCISTGEFHFPNDLAAEIAVRTVKEFLKKQTSVKKVIFNVSKDLDKAIYEKQL